MRTVARTRTLAGPRKKHARNNPEKWCPRCETWKPRTLEHFTRGSTGQWYGYCKLCIIPGKPQSTRNFEKLREVKDNQPCMDCGVSYRHFQLDYDHRPDEEKVDTVTRLCSQSKGWKTILAEIAKCDLVCSNCHRMRTWQRRQLT